MPGLKRDVPERCPLCGEKDAELRGTQVAWGMHKCPHAPQGPSTPPRVSSVDSVKFVPHEQGSNIAIQGSRSDPAGM